MKMVMGFVAVLAFCLGAWAGKGGMDGGGGVGVPLANGSVLFYDLYLVDPQFKDDFSVAPIQVSKFAKTIGFDRYPEIKESQEFALARERLRSWQQSSPVLVETLLQAIGSMEWRYIPYQRALLEEASNGLDLRQVIVFVKGLGALVSAPVWNKMGLHSRAAAIIHEGLRHVQFEYRYSKDDFSMAENTLAEVTAAIVTRQPKAGETWDRPELFGGVLGQKLGLKKHRGSATDLPKAFEDLFAILEKDSPQIDARNLKVLVSQYISNTGDSKVSLPLLEEINRIALSVESTGEVRRKASRVVNIVFEIAVDRAFADITGRTAQLIDVTRDLNGVMPQVLFEDNLRRYVNGDHKGMSRKEKEAWEKVVKAFQDVINQSLSDGTLIKEGV